METLTNQTTDLHGHLHSKKTPRRFLAVLTYSIAMGYLESAVVIYLRETAFGNLSQVFPFRLMQTQIGYVEIIREAATIVMLLTIGYLAGKTTFQKSMYFIFAFSIWDIFYYFFLAIFTGWPRSLGDFDVLFLIPVVWIGPVVAPVLISILLTLTSTVLIFVSERSDHLKLRATNIVIFLAGALMAFYSFTEQIFHILLSKGARGLIGYTPTSFDWITFSIGFSIMSASSIKTVTECYRKLKE
jgi:hypothetical protein